MQNATSCFSLLGKVKKLKSSQKMYGAPCSSGFDSHGVDAGADGSFKKIVIFDEAAMIPTYVIYFENVEEVER